MADADCAVAGEVQSRGVGVRLGWRCGAARASLDAGFGKVGKHLPKVIVLGVDGMDPAFVERHWRDLPELARLRANGTFQPLGTTTPPQSPVAWSTFITGLPPGAHGIFDFVHRDAATLQPFSSMSVSEQPGVEIPLGPYVLPLSHSRVIALRKGTPFWQVLWKRGIPVTVIHMPTNYPPVKAGLALSGMGTPDLRGTLGTFSFYTDSADEISRTVSGGQIIKVEVQDGGVMLPVEGPPDELRRDRGPAVANLRVEIDAENRAARLTTGRDVAVLREGEWSDWLAADFVLIPHLAAVRGTFRVYAKQLAPRLEVYVSAVNIDPASPALPVAEPPEWSRTVAEETGRFFTVGTAEDTSAYRQGVFTREEFRAQTGLVFDEERKLLRYALGKLSEGLLFFYFSSVDQNSHMLWGKYEGELLAVYRAVDACIGEARRAHPDAAVIVMSDHGFTTFDRAVNLNTWLRDRGYLQVDRSRAQDAFPDNVDWAHTQAYGLGLNGLYVNQSGREKYGVVARGEQRRAFLAKLREELTAWRDPVNGRQMVQAVFDTRPAEENRAVAPDLIVGYARGYRASWPTALGGVPDAEVEDNTDAWIADHCIDPDLVPGVLFTSWPVRMERPRLQDVTELILRRFGLRDR